MKYLISLIIFLLLIPILIVGSVKWEVYKGNEACRKYPGYVYSLRVDACIPGYRPWEE